MLQEVIKSIKFTRNPLNNEKKIFEEEKTRKNQEIPMNFQMKDSEKKKENSELSAKNEENNEINKNLPENFKNKEENVIKEKKPEVIHAENTLKFFERMLRFVQLLVFFALVSYIYLL